MNFFSESTGRWIEKIILASLRNAVKSSKMWRVEGEDSMLSNALRELLDRHVFDFGLGFVVSLDAPEGDFVVEGVTQADVHEVPRMIEVSLLKACRAYSTRPPRSLAVQLATRLGWYLFTPRHVTVKGPVSGLKLLLFAHNIMTHLNDVWLEHATEYVSNVQIRDFIVNSGSRVTADMVASMWEHLNPEQYEHFEFLMDVAENSNQLSLSIVFAAVRPEKLTELLRVFGTRRAEDIGALLQLIFYPGFPPVLLKPYVMQILNLKPVERCLLGNYFSSEHHRVVLEDENVACLAFCFARFDASDLAVAYAINLARSRRWADLFICLGSLLSSCETFVLVVPELEVQEVGGFTILRNFAEYFGRDNFYVRTHNTSLRLCNYMELQHSDLSIRHHQMPHLAISLHTTANLHTLFASDTLTLSISV